MSKKNNKEDVMKLLIDKIDKLDDKVDKQNVTLHSMDKTLVKQEENIAEHIRRTNLIESDLKPIKKHVALMNAGLKILGILSILAGIAKALGLF